MCHVEVPHPMPTQGLAITVGVLAGLRYPQSGKTTSETHDHIYVVHVLSESKLTCVESCSHASEAHDYIYVVHVLSTSKLTC